jgi:malate/lactate dehydrogenase
MVSVAIIGTGHVGSSLAFSLIFHPKVENVFLVDNDAEKMQGEIDDLNAASWLLVNGEMFYEWKNQEADFIFICAGFARGIINSVHESDSSLFEANKPVIGRILKKLPKEKCWIITNPSKMLGECFGVKYLGEKLDEVRQENGLMSGLEILDLKGFTNWGIAAEAWKAVDGEKK